MRRKSKQKGAKKQAKPISQTSPEYRRKSLDPRKAIADYKALHAKNSPLGMIEEITSYKRDHKVNTKFYKATWSMIFTIAILNALAIFTTKIVIYEEIGKPKVGTVTPSQESLVHKSL